MVAFVTSVLISALLIGVGVFTMKRRPADAPTTWGEAMVAGAFVFGALFWVFGVVPHQWIQWADSDLGWRPDKFLVGPGEILGELPVDIPYSALRDIGVVIINTVYFVTMVKLWGAWQRRGQAKPVDETQPASDYGRPLVKADA